MHHSEPPTSEGGAPPTWVALAASHFNSRRYWHAHDGWREAALRASSELRPFYEGLILLTWGLAHLQVRNAALARRELSAGLEVLSPYGPVQGELIVEEVVDVCARLLDQLEVGAVPYLIPPVLKFTDGRSGRQPGEGG